VDNDGEVEIVVQADNTGGIGIYSDPLNRWMPGRSVWNQSNYFNVNINDDLSVPIGQQDHSKIAALNMFNQQAPLFDNNFTSSNVIAVPDAIITQAEITSSNTVTLSIQNAGNQVLPSSTLIAFYAGDPTSGTSTLIGTQPLNKAVDAGTLLTDINLTIPGTASESMYLVINDNGTTSTPYSLGTDLPNTKIFECRYTNNLIFAKPSLKATDINATIDTAGTKVLDLVSLITDSNGGSISVLSINDVNLTGGEQNITVPNGEIHIDASDVITFVPNAGFTGVSSFEYVGTQCEYYGNY